MAQKKRFLPRQITRFNYWTVEPPMSSIELTETSQRLGEFPENRWTARPGKSAAHRHIQGMFYLLLNATPEVWERKILPWLHEPISAIRNRPYFALQFYVENDKEWYSDKIAQNVKKGLSQSDREAIDSLDRKTWPPRSKQLEAQLMRTWKELLKSIARDQIKFEGFIDNPPTASQRTGSDQRIYRCYRNQAIKLLGGGGTYIPPGRRHAYQMPNPLDESENPILSTCLNRNGRIESKSWYPINWLDITTRDDQRKALKLTLHWFHHALRNFRLYRDNHPPVPWTSQCEAMCRRVPKEILASRTSLYR